MIEEIKNRKNAPKGVQIAYSIKDRDKLLEFVQEVVNAFDKNQDNPGQAVEEVLITWGLICPF